MFIKETKNQNIAKSKQNLILLRRQKKSLVQQKTNFETNLFKKFQSPSKDNTLLCRYELKYRIRESKAQAIARYIQSYISPDKYSRRLPNFEYPICSLYFDSDEFDLCRETLEKKTNRFKLRIRFYDEDPKSPCFFEIKRRLNRIILKGRARINKDRIQSVIHGDIISDLKYKKDQEVIRQFQFYLKMLQANPTVLVRYSRQAFEDN